MPDLPPRFFKNAAVEPVEEVFGILLDGRPVRTPKGASLAVPTRALAEAVAAEWNALGERVDPRALPLTKLANTAIDGIAGARSAVLDDLRRFGGSDLLCYRAESPEGLVRRQAAAWDPWLAWAGDLFGARLFVTQGVVFAAQPPSAVEFLAAAAAKLDSFGLAALHVAVSLTGSLVLGLALAHGRLDAANAWDIATVDESWQQEQWGVDPEAAERSRALQAQLGHAALVLRLLPR